MNLFAPVLDSMGQLLGPPVAAEIVITLYENEQVNFQVMGRKGPVSPGKTYKLLALVANEVAKGIEPEVTTVQGDPVHE